MKPHLLLVLAVSLTLFSWAPVEAQSPSVVVDCTRGQRLTNALKRGPSKAQLDLGFRGTCRENLVISRDGVSLQGIGANARIEGGLILDGATRITLKNFTASNSPDIGILVGNGSAATLRDLRVENATLRGIDVMNSTANIANTTVDSAKAVGLLVREGSVNLEGTLTFTNNLVGGISVTDSSALFVKDTSVTVQGSPFGMVVQLASSLQFIGGSLNLDRNVVGLLLATGGSAAMTMLQFSASHNSLFGIWVDENSSLSPTSDLPSGEVTISNNGLIGVLVERSSTFELGERAGNAVVSNNMAGLIVDDSSAALANTTLENNPSGDLILRFGARAVFQTSVTMTKMSCDATVLTRGPNSCPSSLTQSLEASVLEAPAFKNRRALRRF